MAETVIPWLLVLGPVAVIAYFVLRAIVDPSRLTTGRSGPRWQPGHTGLADSAGGIVSGVPDAQSALVTAVAIAGTADRTPATASMAVMAAGATRVELGQIESSPRA